MNTEAIQKYQAKLLQLNINNSKELINFLPVSYMDLSKVSDLEKSQDGSFVLVDVRITAVSRPIRVQKLSIFKAKAIYNDSIELNLNFYNHSFAAKVIKIDDVIRIYGKIKIEGLKIVINNPLFSDCGDKSKLNGIKTIYPTKGLIMQSVLRSIIETILNESKISSLVPKEEENKYKLMPLYEAYKKAHFPNTMEEAVDAKKRISLEKIVTLMSAYSCYRQNNYTKRRCFFDTDKEVLAEIKIPFELTLSQKNAIEDMLKTLKTDKLLNSLIIGDVGSGKTIVSLYLAFFVAKSKKQVCLMAPTEVLAIQHFKSFNAILAENGLNIALLTGSTSQKEKKRIYSDLSDGKIDILIGTHSVISNGVEFKDLALIIIDEQQRFGVEQRKNLFVKGNQIDTITLSATPIPRSLLLTFYGDLDVINIENRFDKSNIVTRIVGKDKRDSMLKYIVDECKKGQQAYIICPKIYDEEGIELNNIEKVCAEMEQFNDVKIEALSGKSKDKKEILERFYKNETQILIATTVVEVGIDCKNATLMVIFDAEMFGLSTLHQLRGRIGRQGDLSYCFLYTEKEEDDEKVRLRIMMEETDGGKIAERDYELRGAGDYMSINQSGKSKFNFPIDLIKKAKIISKTVDIVANKDVLIAFAERFLLDKVVLN